MTDTSKEGKDINHIQSNMNADVRFDLDEHKTDNEYLGVPEPSVTNETVSKVSPWLDPTEHPEAGVNVLCELNPRVPVSEREYVKGQFDHHTGNFFTNSDGPYKILDVARWMEVK